MTTWSEGEKQNLCYPSATDMTSKVLSSLSLTTPRLGQKVFSVRKLVVGQQAVPFIRNLICFVMDGQQNACGKNSRQHVHLLVWN